MYMFKRLLMCKSGAESYFSGRFRASWLPDGYEQCDD